MFRSLKPYFSLPILPCQEVTSVGCSPKNRPESPVVRVEQQPELERAAEPLRKASDDLGRGGIPSDTDVPEEHTTPKSPYNQNLWLMALPWQPTSSELKSSLRFCRLKDSRTTWMVLSAAGVPLSSTDPARGEQNCTAPPMLPRQLPVHCKKAY